MIFGDRRLRDLDTGNVGDIEYTVMEDSRRRRVLYHGWYVSRRLRKAPGKEGGGGKASVEVCRWNATDQSGGLQGRACRYHPNALSESGCAPLTEPRSLAESGGFPGVN